jgi:KipI family sensor histidine kinase inhibitor
LLLQFDNRIDAAINARVVSTAANLQQLDLPGVRDVVASFCSVAVFFDPRLTGIKSLIEAMRRSVATSIPRVSRAIIEVPVVYGGEEGPDLAEVANWAGLSVDEVIGRHVAQLYNVFMMGFLPGFAYLGTVDRKIAAPRRSRPRVRVPKGSVGIAGRQTGIYPNSSPGGWQLVGRSQLNMFDPMRNQASLLTPGDRVRFVPVNDLPEIGAEREGAVGNGPLPGARFLEVLQPGMFTTVQDLGRWGYQDLGVPVAGAMDAEACRCSNLAVGNQPDAAVLEVTVVGPELRFEMEVDVAVTGADLSPTIDGDEIPRGRAVHAGAGAILQFGERRAGARAYVAFDGGVDVPLVLGSRSTCVRSVLGGLSGRPLQGGDRVPLGKASSGQPVVVGLNSLPVSGARLRIVPGPQVDVFASDALTALFSTRFTVTSQSDRMGYRLAGSPLPGTSSMGVMISDTTFVGALQVPPSGEPILLLADRPTTGGYPQIGVIASADLDKAAQLVPGDWIEFIPCSRHEAVAALSHALGES